MRTDWIGKDETELFHFVQRKFNNCIFCFILHLFHIRLFAKKNFYEKIYIIRQWLLVSVGAKQITGKSKKRWGEIVLNYISVFFYDYFKTLISGSISKGSLASVIVTSIIYLIVTVNKLIWNYLVLPPWKLKFCDLLEISFSSNSVITSYHFQHNRHVSYWFSFFQLLWFYQNGFRKFISWNSLKTEKKFRTLTIWTFWLILLHL